MIGTITSFAIVLTLIFGLYKLMTDTLLDLLYDRLMLESNREALIDANRIHSSLHYRLMLCSQRATYKQLSNLLIARNKQYKIIYAPNEDITIR